MRAREKLQSRYAPPVEARVELSQTAVVETFLHVPGVPLLTHTNSAPFEPMYISRGVHLAGLVRCQRERRDPEGHAGRSNRPPERGVWPRGLSVRGGSERGEVREQPVGSDRPERS